MKQYFDKTSCRNICMYICYAHTKIQLNPISNFSNICKTNFQNPRDSKTHPRVLGMSKKVSAIMAHRENFYAQFQKTMRHGAHGARQNYP